MLLPFASTNSFKFEGCNLRQISATPSGYLFLIILSIKILIVNIFLMFLRILIIDQKSYIVYTLDMSKYEFFNLYLKYNYGATAVANFNYTINDGDKVVLVGSSGSGKTTLLLAMCGLMPIFSGNILVDGKDIREIKLKEQDVVYVPDRDNLFLYRSIEYNLTYPLKKYKLSKKEVSSKISKALDIVDLRDKIKKRVIGLNQIDRVKLAYARIFLRESSNVFLDDFVKTLPTDEQDVINRLITNYVKNSNKTVVIATENIEFAKSLTDKIVVFNEGFITSMDDNQCDKWQENLEVFRLRNGDDSYKVVLKKDDIGLFVEIAKEIVRLSNGELIDDIFIGEEILFFRRLNVAFDVISERKIFC